MQFVIRSIYTKNVTEPQMALDLLDSTTFCSTACIFTFDIAINAQK